MKLSKELTGCDQFGKNIYNHHYQRVLIQRHSKESTIRFIVKAMMSKIMYDENKSFVSEWQYKISNKIIDSLPLIDVDDNIIYRFNDPKVNVNIKNFRTKIVSVDELKTNMNQLKDLENELRGLLGYANKRV